MSEYQDYYNLIHWTVEGEAPNYYVIERRNEECPYVRYGPIDSLELVDGLITELKRAATKLLDQRFNNPFDRAEQRIEFQFEILELSKKLKPIVV